MIRRVPLPAVLSAFVLVAVLCVVSVLSRIHDSGPDPTGRAASSTATGAAADLDWSPSTEWQGTATTTSAPPTSTSSSTTSASASPTTGASRGTKESSSAPSRAASAGAVPKTSRPSSGLSSGFPSGLSPGMLLGARVRLPNSDNEGADFAWGQQAYGPLQVTRDYISGPVPTRYVNRFPPSTQVILSLKSVAGPLASFLGSLDTRSVSRIVFQHEPERPDLFSSGDDFVRRFDAARSQIRAIRPEIQVGIASSGFSYHSSRPGAEGSYLSTQADFYTIDTYRAGTDDNANSNGVVPIEERPEIMQWYALVKGRGKPLGITEVGMGRVGGGADPGTPFDRVRVVAQDVAWARAHGFFCYSYFLSGEGPDGHNWLDNSTAFQAMFRALPRG